MKKMLPKSMLSFAFLSLSAWAQTPPAASAEETPAAPAPAPMPAPMAADADTTGPSESGGSNWLIESTLQFHSMASSGNSMFGPSLFYGANGKHQIGLRTLLSIGSQGAYQATLAYRYSCLHTQNRLFAEIGASYNIINFNKSVPSAGFALGFLHKLTSDLSIGGNAGFEFFDKNGPVSGYMKIGDSVHFTPKASLLVSIQL